MRNISIFTTRSFQDRQTLPLPPSFSPALCSSSPLLFPMPRAVEEGDFNSLSSTPRGSWILPTTPPNAPGHGLGSRFQPLSLKQAIQKYSQPCVELMRVNTTIALICVVAAMPYMTWAAFAGNFATLAKGIRHVPKWNTYLEGVDTLLIGVCDFYLFSLSFEQTCSPYAFCLVICIHFC